MSEYSKKLAIQALKTLEDMPEDTALKAYTKHLMKEYWTKVRNDDFGPPIFPQ